MSVAACCALGAIGCLSGDDTVAPGGGIDASVNVPDTGVSPHDAGGVVDGAGKDAGTDADAAPPQDAGTDAADAAPTDAGVDAAANDGGITVAATLVPAGSLSKSTKYTLNGTVGPATAPVLRSPKYQLVGGMAASTQSK